MKRRIFYTLLLGTAFFVVFWVFQNHKLAVALLTGCGWVEKTMSDYPASSSEEFRPNLNTNITLRGWVVDIPSKHEEKLGCLYDKRPIVFSEFVDNYEYSKTKYPDARRVELRPVEVVILQYELDMSAGSPGPQSYMKYMDKQGSLYLQKRQAGYPDPDLSSVAVFSTEKAYQETFFGIAEHFQNLQKEDPNYVPKSYSYQPMYACVTNPEFVKNMTSIAHTCYQNTDTKSVESLTFHACSCERINDFIHSRGGEYLFAKKYHRPLFER